MNAIPFSWRRVGLIARNTAREAARQRLFNFMAVVAVLLVVGVQSLGLLNFGSSELRFISDVGFGATAFFGAVLTIVAAAQLFHAELERGSVATLLAKPVRRSEFMLGKLGGVALILAVFCTLLTGVIDIVLWTRETSLMRLYPEAFDRGRAVDYGAVLVAGFAQWLKLTLLAAMTLCVASFARTQLFTAAIGFVIAVSCQLQFFAQTQALKGGSALGRMFAAAISISLPDFQRFDLSETVGAGSGIGGIQVARLVLYSGSYVIAVWLAASYAFSRREI